MSDHKVVHPPSQVDETINLFQQYDLTNSISQYLDRHLIYPLLEFIQKTEIYQEQDILTALLELLSSTKMIDDVVAKYNKLHNLPEDAQPNADLAQARMNVIKQLNELSNECNPLLKVLLNHKIVDELRNKNNLTIEGINAYCGTNNSIASMDNLFKFALYKYNCGYYCDVATLLYYYLLLSTDPNTKLITSPDNIFSAMWGKLNCEILLNNYEVAIEDFTRLYDAIESRANNSNTALLIRYRAWLLHYSLFVYFNSTDQRNNSISINTNMQSIIDLFLQPEYLNTLQSTTPYLLRYLIVAALCTSTKHSSVSASILKNDILRLVKEEEEYYEDPFTMLILALFDSYDFEHCTELLKQCEYLASKDYFISNVFEEFISNMRNLFFESYSSIHHLIDMNSLSSMLNLSPDKFESWIIDQIRQHHLHHSQYQLFAKINSKDNQIQISSSSSLISSIFNKLNQKVCDSLAYR